MNHSNQSFCTGQGVGYTNLNDKIVTMPFCMPNEGIYDLRWLLKLSVD